MHKAQAQGMPRQLSCVRWQLTGLPSRGKRRHTLVQELAWRCGHAKHRPTRRLTYHAVVVAQARRAGCQHGAAAPQKLCTEGVICGRGVCSNCWLQVVAQLGRVQEPTGAWHTRHRLPSGACVWEDVYRCTAGSHVLAGPHPAPCRATQSKLTAQQTRMGPGPGRPSHACAWPP